MRTFTTLLFCVITLLVHAAGIQRMGIRAGTRVLLKSKGISRVATQCMDNTLGAPKPGMEFINVLTDGTARVVSADGRYAYNKTLREAVKSGDIEIVGTEFDMEKLITNIDDPYFRSGLSASQLNEYDRFRLEWLNASQEEKDLQKLLFEIAYTDGYYGEMSFRNTTYKDLKIEFSKNTILAETDDYTMAGMWSSYLDLGQDGGWNAKNAHNQKQLKDLGYYDGAIDGDIGDASERAIRNFQQENGIAVTGKITPETDAQLIRQCSELKNRITAYQKALQRIGEYDGIIDGIHGPKSEQAFLNFFRKSGIENTIDLRRGYFYKDGLLLKKIEQFYLKNLDTDNLPLYTITRTEQGYLITKKGDLSPSLGPVTQLNGILEEIGNSQTLFDLKGFNSSEFDAFKLTVDAHKNADNLILMNRSSMKDLGTYSDVFNSHYTSYKMGNVEKLSENNFRLEASFATGTGATQKLTLWAKSMDALNKLKDKIKALFSSNPSVRSLDILKGLKRKDAPIYKGIFNGAEFGQLTAPKIRTFFLHEKALAVA